jgi:hypothetical protein
MKCTPVKPFFIEIFLFANIQYNNLHIVTTILSNVLLLASKDNRDLFIFESSTFKGSFYFLKSKGEF